MHEIPDRAIPLAYNVSDLCFRLGIKRSSIYNLFAAGKLRKTKILGRTVVLHTEVERFLADLERGR